MVTLQDLVRRVESQLSLLPDKPEETAASTARALWFAAAGMSKSAEAAQESEPPELTASQGETLEALLLRRLAGEPLSHITGRQRFLGLEMLASDDALVPRKETEILGDAAIRLVQAVSTESPQPRIVDICTGSGNIALAIADRCPEARVFAADLSDRAVEAARRNASHLGLQARVEFRVGDLLEPFRTPDFLGQTDVLSCNPPYISSAKVRRLPDEIGGHEPSLAFDGGPLGIGVLMRLLKEAPAFLRPGGWLVFEVGLGQGPSLMKMAGKNPAYQEVRSAGDAGGDIRVIMARC